MKWKAKIKIGKLKMKVLGIDPAYSKPNAFAVYENGKIISHGLFSDMEQYETLLTAVDVVALEEQYFNDQINNHDTLKKLSRVMGVLIYLAEKYMVPIRYVYPSAWMSSIGIKKNVKRGASRDAWIKKVAMGLIGSNKQLGIDEACAINIAAYAARRQ